MTENDGNGPSSPTVHAPGSFSRRQALRGAGALGAGAALTTALAPPASAAQTAAPQGQTSASSVASRSDAAESGFAPKLDGVHPRLILGTSVSAAELARRRNSPAYADFVSTLYSYCDNRTDLPAVDSPGNDGQWQTVYWALPELAIAYRLSGKDAYRTKVRNWTLYVTDQTKFPDWGVEDGGSMSNAVTLIGVSVAYDWCYDLFSASERTQIRDKIALQVDKLRAAFTDTAVAANAYWKADFSNNHHMIRLGGLVAAASAIYGDGADESGESDAARLDFARWQIREFMTWLAPDGSQHEGPSYFNYGYEHIVRSLDIFECVTGESLWDERVHEMGTVKTHVSLPGLWGQAEWGDTDGTLNYFNPYLWKIAAHYRDGWLQDFLAAQYAAGPAGRTSFVYNAWNILWYDDSLERESRAAGMPTDRYLPDLEYLASRSGWTDSDLSLHFKCGPIGGHRLNAWRDRLGPDTTYVNVAHDHPDAGDLTLSFGGYRWGNYAPYEYGLTKYTNTVVAGADVGQAGEAAFGFFQPYTAMHDRASITSLLIGPTDTIVVGDAAKAYQQPSKAGLTGFQRHIAFIDRQYAVVVDNVASAAAQNLHALFHCSGTYTGSPNAGWVITQNTAATPAALELYLGSPTSGATATVGADFLPALGTLWRLTAPNTTNAQLVTVLFPQRGGASLQSAPPTVTQDAEGTKVAITQGTTVDRFAVALGPSAGALSAPDVTANGQTLLTRHVAGVLQRAALNAGQSLSTAIASLTVTQTASLAVAGTTSSMSLTIAPLPGQAKPAGVAVSGLTPGATYTIRSSDGPAGRIQADGHGAADVSLADDAATSTLVLTRR